MSEPSELQFSWVSANLHEYVMGKKEQSCFSHPYHIVSQAGPQPSGEATESEKKAMWVIFGKWCVCLVLVAALLVGGVIPGRWMQPLSYQ